MVRFLFLAGVLTTGVSWAEEDFHSRYFRSVFDGDLSWVVESEEDSALKSDFAGQMDFGRAGAMVKERLA